jgi:hypothetical protein
LSHEQGGRGGRGRDRSRRSNDADESSKAPRDEQRNRTEATPSKSNNQDAAADSESNSKETPKTNAKTNTNGGAGSSATKRRRRGRKGRNANKSKQGKVSESTGQNDGAAEKPIHGVSEDDIGRSRGSGSGKTESKKKGDSNMNSISIKKTNNKKPKEQKPDGGKNEQPGEIKNASPKNDVQKQTTPRDDERKSQPKKVEDTKALAIKRFDLKPRPMGIPSDIDPPPRRIDVTWANSPVPLAVQKEVGQKIVRRGEFGYLADERVQEIAKQIESYPINLDQALSLRGAINQEKSVFGHHRLLRQAPKLARRYDSGTDILDLAKDADSPPVNVFRTILANRGWGKNRIKESLKNPDRLKKRDQEQFKIAEEADRVANVDQTETHQAADVFEEVLCDHFTSLGIRFKTQNQLMAEQMKSEGRPIRTPDLLLLDDVRVDGVPIAWIDAKHFFGAALSFPRKKTQKQVDRYSIAYGHGAIVYRHGFCDGLKLRGALLLDSSPLDLSVLHAHHDSRTN